MLTVHGLHKKFGALEVVRGVSFEVSAGECYGLLGPNGAGKTTTLRCCLGLTAPDAGAITLDSFIDVFEKEVKELADHSLFE